jgi:hypothetical protein
LCTKLALFTRLCRDARSTKHKICFKSWFNSLHVRFRNYSPDFDIFFYTALAVIRHILCWFMPNITSLMFKSVATGFLKKWATHLTWKIIQTALGSKTFIGNIFQSSEYFKQVTEKIMCAVMDCIVVEVYQLSVDMKTNEVCKIMENTFASCMFSRFKSSFPLLSLFRIWQKKVYFMADVTCNGVYTFNLLKICVFICKHV